MVIKKVIYICAVILLFIANLERASASHAAGMDIAYECISSGFTSDTYKVTLKFYRDCSGIPAPSSHPLNYSSSCGSGTVNMNMVGSAVDINPACLSYCNGGNALGVEQYTYEATISLAHCSNWVLSVCESARNNTINTISNPGNQDLCVEATINNTVYCNNSPSFTQYPTPFICVGSYYCYNNGVIEVDGDSLVYSLITPLNNNTGGTISYIAPYSANNPVGGGSVFDAATGNLCITPSAVISGVLALKVSEYRGGVLIGSVIRDIQINTFPCTSITPPSLTGIDTTAVVDISAPVLYTYEVNCDDTLQAINFDVNTINIQPPAPTSVNITITINTAFWGNEISWDITSGGVIITQGSGYSSNATYTVTACVPIGNLVFNMYDSWGDGWNGGTYTITGNTTLTGTTSGGLVGMTSSGSNSFAISGGTPCTPASNANVTMVWNSGIPGATFTVANNNTLNPIGTFNWNLTSGMSGTYFFTVNVSNTSCPAPGNFSFQYKVVINQTEITILNQNITNASCYGISDGAIGITSGGLNPPFTYLWSTGDTITNINNLDSGFYYLSIIDFLGCNYLDTFIISEPPQVVSTTSVTQCSSYLWNGNSYTVSGTYSDTLSNLTGCDSIATLNLTIDSITTSTTIITACNSFLWNGTTYTAGGVYDDTLINTVGCDSVARLNLTITSNDSSTAVIIACDSYTWIDGVTYTASNTTATHTLVNAVGCDSIVHLDLTIYNSSSSTAVIMACDSYTWIDGVTYTASNTTATHILLNAAGCDSIVYLDLTIYNSSSSTAVITACDSYTWIDGVTYTASNTTATHTLVNAVGCDSIILLNLSINPITISTSTVVLCDTTYLWNGVMYTTSGIYSDTLMNALNCDSIAVIDLTINSSNSGASFVTICDSTYFWNGTVYAVSGIYTAILTNMGGCDSTATLNLTINSSTLSSETHVVCDSLYWNGITYSSSGVYTYTTLNSVGCDSVITLNLTVIMPSTSLTNITLCDSTFFWNGFIYTTTGIYTYTTVNAAGCDSVATLNLTINNSSFYQQNITACNTYLWNGNTYLLSGTYTDTTINSVGCDSISTLYLTINNTSTSTTLQTVCDSLFWNGAVYTSSGLYNYVTTNAVGCDSTAYLDLTVNNSTISNANVSLCDVPYLWNGVLYGTSGVYTYTTVNTVGCDSTAILDLIIYSSTTSTSNVMLCDTTYLWNGTTYATSGVYTYSTLNAVGCDSIATLNLTINYSSTSNTVITACDTFLWNGIYYTTSGLYTYSTLNAVGCDSTAFLDLTLNYSTLSTSFMTLCDTSYLWNGITYLVSGTYTAVLTNAIGCDSLAVLNLIINSSSVSNTFDTACDTYLWNGILYDSTGVYDTTFAGANVLGCDSTAILHLVINSSANISQVTIAFKASNYSSYNISCNAESNGWLKADIIGGSPPFLFSWNTSSIMDSIYNLSAGAYILSIVDDLGCSISDTVVLTEPDLLSSSIAELSDYNGYPISCYAASDGKLMVELQGGVSPYTLLWNSVFTTDTINALSEGIYKVIVEDENGCLSTDSIELLAPNALLTNVDVFTDTCEKGVGAADIMVYGGVSPYTYLWDSGENTAAVNSLFEGENSCLVVDANQCTTVENIIVENIPSPDLDFRVIPSYRRFYDQIENPFVYIDDTEMNGHQVISWYWDFGDTTYSYDSVAWHSYAYMDTFNVSLIIETAYNCVDSFTVQVIVNDYQLYIPNAFTPNTNDNYNNEFRAYGYGVAHYLMRVYDRWGGLIFESDDIDLGWNGTVNDGVEIAPTGIYAYRIQVVNIFGEELSYTGQIQLIH